MNALNVQPIEKRTEKENGDLDVQKVFYTIQGEGPFAGQPAVFIRLSGCNLQCPDCDTVYTGPGRETLSPGKIVDRVMASYAGVREPGRPKPLIVITGGEPFRQNFGPLCRELIENSFINIQVETNGTLWQEDVPILPITVVCSPKTPHLDENLLPYIKGFKYVLEDGHIDPHDGLPTSVLGKEIRPARPPEHLLIRRGMIWVQPLDLQDPTLNKKNLKACVDVALKFGYRISVQTHKLMEVE